MLTRREVLKISVATGDAALPATLNPVPRIPEQCAVTTRDLALIEHEDDQDNPVILLLNDLHFDDPTTENPRMDTTEIWRLVNLTEDTHPIHLHLVQFQILDRIPFDPERYRTDRLAPLEAHYIGPAVPPEAREAGWKDTVKANPDEVTRIIAHFDRVGRYVWHCHILEHEDNGIMRRMKSYPRRRGTTIRESSRNDLVSMYGRH